MSTCSSFYPLEAQYFGQLGFVGKVSGRDGREFRGILGLSACLWFAGSQFEASGRGWLLI